jgi:hypothetical protein
MEMATTLPMLCPMLERCEGVMEHFMFVLRGSNTILILTPSALRRTLRQSLRG